MITRKSGAWAVFDWGNSAISTIIFTFVFPVYFAQSIFGDDTLGSAQWSFAIGLAGLVTAILAPLVGGMADHYGPRKPLLGLLCGVTVIATLSLSLMPPQAAWILPALLLAGLATLTFELGQSIYNSMLNDVAAPPMRGRISGIAWGLGYFGGLSCLVISLFGLIGLGDTPPLLRLPQEGEWPVRASFVLAGLWMGIFILPLFFLCPDHKRSQLSLAQSAKRGITDIAETLGDLWQDRNMRFFIIGSALYRDGLITLFAIGGLYAADQFGMGFADILIFAIGLNVMSGLGAICLSVIDDRAGPKTTILISLAGLTLCGLVILFFIDSKTGFMITALILGIFIGPAQSAGRVMMAGLSPADEQSRYFGFYAMTGKAAAFTGPILYGGLTTLFNTQDAGLAAILGLWVIGAAFILFVGQKRITDNTAHP